MTEIFLTIQDTSLLAVAYRTYIHDSLGMWLKALHIIGFIAWFAAVFYIWRLFVYQVEATSPEVKAQLQVMARRLYKIIMMPAMLFTLVFGLWLLFTQPGVYLKGSGWMHAKLTLLVILIGHHHMANYYRKKLEAGREYSSKFFRIMNEVPTILMILIVILAVFKPF